MWQIIMTIGTIIMSFSGLLHLIIEFKEKRNEKKNNSNNPIILTPKEYSDSVRENKRVKKKLRRRIFFLSLLLVLSGIYILLLLPVTIDYWHGFTPHNFTDRHDVTWKYKNEKANQFFDIINSFPKGIISPNIKINMWQPQNEFIQKSMPHKYDALFHGLKNDEVQFGFMSTLNTLVFRKNKRNGLNKENFKVIGYKRMVNKYFNSVDCRTKSIDTYNSGYAISKDLQIDFKISGLKKLINTIFTRNDFAICLSDVKESSSSYHIPLLYLSQQGIDWTDSTKIQIKTYVKNPERTETRKLVMLMRKAVEEKSLICFAMSDEDFYQRLDDSTRHKFDFFKIPIDIPYDPIIVYKDTWKDLEEKEIIKAALALAGCYILPDYIDLDEIDIEYDNYGKLIGSGIIIEHLGEKKYYKVLLSQLDLIGLKDTLLYSNKNEIKVLIRNHEMINKNCDFLASGFLKIDNDYIDKLHCILEIREKQKDVIIKPGLLVTLF